MQNTAIGALTDEELRASTAFLLAYRRSQADTTSAEAFLIKLLRLYLRHQMITSRDIEWTAAECHLWSRPQGGPHAA